MTPLAQSVPDLESVAHAVGSAVDWDHGSLVGSAARKAWMAGDPQAVGLLVGHLRARPTPFLGFTAETIEAVRRSATSAQREAAFSEWEAALGGELLLPYHSNSFAALGPETIFLVQNPAMYDAMAQKVLAAQENWKEGLFGVTHGIVDLVRMLWSLPDCSDDVFIPIFGWMLARYPAEWDWVRIWSERTLSPTGHNWWAHALPGFWMMATFFPEFEGARRFATLSADYLERELVNLFEADGWSKEGSPGYHEFAFLSLETMAELAAANGLAISPKVEVALSRIAGATWKMLLPDCNFPVFGDWVRGNPYSGFVGQWRRDRQPGNLLRRRAARYGNRECKFVAEALDPAHLVSGGSDPLFGFSPLASAYEDLKANEPPPDSSLPASGYYVMRSAWKPEADALAFTAASIGPAITSHKHADLLSFELVSRGRRILVDNGYGSPAIEAKGEGQRMWRVGTAAHNTCLVDGEDQSRVVAEFRYADHVAPLVDAWSSTPAYAYLSAVHDGYRRRPNPVAAVRRKIFWLRGEYWIVIDRFTTASAMPHDYQLNFHSAPPCALWGGQDGVRTLGEGGNLLIQPLFGVDGPPAIFPNPHPLEGYENPVRICYGASNQGDWVIATLLVPFEDDDIPSVRFRAEPVHCDGALLTPWQATALTIQVGEKEDFFFCHHMVWNLPWESAGTAGIRRLFHSRCPTIQSESL